MHLALVEQAPERGQIAHGADSDALRAPCEAPRCGEHVDGGEHGVKIVERLAHAHEHDVGEGVALGYGQNLVDNLRGGKVAVEALAAGHAEGAAHLASRLRAHAERGPVAVGDVDGLYVAASGAVEEILHRAVGAACLGLGILAAHAPARGERLASALAEVGHRVDVGDTAAVYPVRYLLGGKTRKAALSGHGTQLGRVHAHQRCLFLSIHTAKVLEISDTRKKLLRKGSKEYV